MSGLDVKGDPLVFKLQLLLCLFAGIFVFLLFCFLRYKWPQLFALRTLRTKGLKPIPTGFFDWIVVTYRITDEEVLQYSGLDAYVYLMFFKMGVRTFAILSLFAIFILSPLRYYFTGNYDKDGIGWDSRSNDDSFGISKSRTPDFSDDFPKFYWVYPIFTYLFSFYVYKTVLDYSKEILRTRQKYLAAQDSITDRTIRLHGIPRSFLKKNDTDVLKKFIEDLGIGKVMEVKFIYDWSELDNLMAERKGLLNKLEELYTYLYLLKIDIYTQKRPLSVTIAHSDIDQYEIQPKKMKYKDELDRLTAELELLDDKIKVVQSKYNRDNSVMEGEKPLSTAFITMDSVASAQMAAQTVLDPRVYKLLVELAPAPRDIVWDQFRLGYYEKKFKSYLITFIVVISYASNSVLVTPLTTLLDPNTIKKVWPGLAEAIKSSRYLTTFVTGILPPLLFSLLNISLPYFYQYLSRHQAYSTTSEIELATFLKNFFFVFFNLFLVFLATGTFWDYFSYVSDTTQIAYLLARSLRKQSLFYVDLILLQGLAMFPVRLLQIGDFVISNVFGRLFFVRSLILRTPRDYRFYYYTPPIFDFGIQLPQHILIYMIVLIYSVVSTKIVTSGLVYFVLGYLVYKYQLVYNFVHPQHSTGKIWPLIFKRVLLGILIFQLFMCGTLALEGAILLSTLCVPLVFITLIFGYNYEKHYRPLNEFIALRALLNPFGYDREFNDDSEGTSDVRSEGLQSDSSQSNALQSNEALQFNQTNGVRLILRTINRRRSTLDEERDVYADYTYPSLIDPLDGPCVGFDGDYLWYVQDTDSSGDVELGFEDSQKIIRKRPRVAEWE